MLRDTHPNNALSLFHTFTLSLSHFHRWLSALTFYVSIFDTLAIENLYDLGIDAAIATMLKASGYRSY